MNDDLTIPAFLRRTERPTQEQIDAITRPSTRPREWIMPDRTKYQQPIEENTMAKIDFHIENRDAPVNVWRDVNGEPEKVHEFKNASEFEAWYRPNKMRFLGRTAHDRFTDVMLDIDRSALPRVEHVAGKANHFKVTLPAEARRNEPTVRKERPGRDTTGRYVDKRHVAKIEATGMKQVSNAPITYEGKGLRVVIAPPAPGSAWSSNWTVTKGTKVLGTGKGIGGLLKLIG